MPLLPPVADAGDYFAAIHGQPPPFWQAALSVIAARHGLPDGPWERAALGRNVVFLGPGAVVKLGPPCWPGDIAVEAAALAAVDGRLPVRTPAPIAAGELDTWEYLISERCAGTNLYTLWPDLSAAERVALAEQHGRLMAAVHALPVAELPAKLAFDWERMIGGQRANLVAALAHSGLQAELVRGAEPFLEEFAGLSAVLDAPVLVHGDLSHLNFLVERAGDSWTIVALLDWGDVKIGPWTHELISPAMHMYRGEREPLHAWYAGYGRIRPEQAPDVAGLATARAMLYYAGEFAEMLGRVRGGAACRSWPEVADCLWRLRGR